ncbi:cupin domain-containing protein [Paenibacillus senegalensis]|uniref:cupin domain-containing protein n=1 Tax=Paenibacillus senegalensis TaxID=1465766 RepID=UPI0002891B41|nr:cupin domain-containing protein [Paenibacillus senegalensis]
MISKNNAEHYIWGNNCDGWRLVDEEEQSIIHECMPPGTSEIRHFHSKLKQFFFVLTGVITIELDEVEYTLGKHEGIEVKPNVPHQVFNRSDKDSEFLVISQPNNRNDRTIVD